MQERMTDAVGVQDEAAKDVLTEILREGAHKPLADVIRGVQFVDDEKKEAA